MREELYGGHGLLRTRQGFTFLPSGEEVEDHGKVVTRHCWFARD